MPNLDLFFERVYRCTYISLQWFLTILRRRLCPCNWSYHAAGTGILGSVPACRQRLLRIACKCALDLVARCADLNRRYYQEKGFWVIVTARVLNLLALGFTAAFSGFLLLWVNWGALKAECIQQDTCDILEVLLNLFSALLHLQQVFDLRSCVCVCFTKCAKGCPGCSWMRQVAKGAQSRVDMSGLAPGAGGHPEAPAAAWGPPVVGGPPCVCGAAGRVLGLEPGAPRRRPQEPCRGAAVAAAAAAALLMAKVEWAAIGRGVLLNHAC